MKPFLLTILLLTFYSLTIAQVEFEKLIPQTEEIGFTRFPTEDIQWVFGDIDGDSDQDLVYTTGGYPRIYRNNGFGGFEIDLASFNEGNPISQATVRLTDFDSDGDLDILINGQRFNSTTSIFFLSNNGNGNFTEVPIVFDGFTAPTELSGDLFLLADKDNDGDDDIFLPNNFGTLRVFQNDGNGVIGSFQSVITGFSSLSFSRYILSDFNGDDLVDIVSRDRLILNNGDGIYGSSFEYVERDFSNYSAYHDFDYDGDGDNDILWVGTFADDPLVVHVNDGFGNFGEEFLPSFASNIYGNSNSVSTYILDIDQDNLEDLLFSFNGQTQVYYNQAGTFAEPQVLDFDINGVFSFQDLNGDTINDFFANGMDEYENPYTAVILATDSGYVRITDSDFATYSLLDQSESGSIPFVSDFDLDGDLDVVVFDIVFDQLDTYINDGEGRFEKFQNNEQDVFFFNNSLLKKALVDIDQDGDQDIFISGIAANNFADEFGFPTNRIYINNNGQFTTNPNFTLGFLSENLEGIHFQDLDLNGTPDLVSIERLGENDLLAKIYLNSGGANFTEFGFNDIVPVEDATIASAKLNSDELPDLIITGSDPANGGDALTQVLLNAGSGILLQSDENGILDTEDGMISFGDIDGDNDVDVALQGKDGFSDRSKIYLNNGDASFEQMAGTVFFDDESTLSGFKDVDNDGDLDIVTFDPTVLSGERFAFSENDSQGNFESLELVGIGNQSTLFTLLKVRFFLDDFNGDSLPDILLFGRERIEGEWSNIVALYENNYQPCTDSDQDGFCSDEFGCVDYTIDGVTFQGGYLVGDDCFDGRTNTINDHITENCECIGTYVNKCLEADLNGDGIVNNQDVQLFANLFMQPCSGVYCEADFNQDQKVDIGDFNILQSFIGETCQP
ncbi:MAG: FG-GAP-like repeat-containing protein [Cryomorphaceae bacterium]